MLDSWAVGLSGRRLSGRRTIGILGYNAHARFLSTRIRADEKPRLMLYVQRKSDLPLHIGQIHAFYFDTTLYSWIDDVNTKSVRLNNLIDVCLWYCIETTCTTLQTVVSYYLRWKCYKITGVDLKISLASLSLQLELADTNEITPSHTLF